MGPMGFWDILGVQLGLAHMATVCRPLTFVRCGDRLLADSAGDSYGSHGPFIDGL